MNNNKIINNTLNSNKITPKTLRVVMYILIAATVMFVHHASSSPSEDTMFLIVLSERTPNSVPIMLPEPPVSIVPPIIDEAMAFISAPLA